jgi:hypothetical protein
MRLLSAFLLPLLLFLSTASGQQLSSDDEVRIAEARRLAGEVGDRIWKGWHLAPFPVLLVTPATELLIGYPQAPTGFEKVGHSDRLNSHVYARPRQFPTSLLATFPAFGDQVPVIVIGQPQNTNSKTSDGWVITLLHEHFHQLQNSQPGYFQQVTDLGLSKGDQTGMWMLNYDFPYKESAEPFLELKALLLDALNTSDKKQFQSKAAAYVLARKKFMAGLKDDDHKYISFQLWQEGMARYTELKVAEAIAERQPSADFSKLPDFEAFSSLGEKARSSTLKELEQARLEEWKRRAFYSFGAAEGLLLDRLNPKWKDKYFTSKFSTDSYFEAH